MKQILFRPKVVALAVMAALAVSCSDDDGYRQPQPSGEGDVEVMIMMNVPSVASSTRAMTKKQENSIDYLNVLVFLDPRDGSDETYLYTTYATDYLASDDGSTSTVKVGFRKNVSGEYHRFVFIANMKDRVAELQGSWDETMTKADVLQTLTFDAYPATAATEPDRIWDTATPRYLPMWGETTDSYVVTSTLMGSTLGTIKMLRSVATVDIVLNPDVDGSPLGFGSGVFELQDIKVYNVPQKGYAAPDPDNLTAMLAEKPTYSTTFSRNAATVVAYGTDHSADENLYGISRLVYIPEAPNTDGAGTNIDDLEQTCLVISGYYDGSPDLSWYRLDFIDKLSTTENVRYDILRNHRYTFYITAVEGPGYPDEPTAFKSAPLNLDTEVLVWDEENMPDIVFDGNYAFRVNPPDSVVMYKEGSKKYITVKTDHPGGWDIDEDTLPDFISNHWIEPGIDRDTLYFEATPITNALEVTKEGYITFLSGKLRKKVKIIQLNEAELTITVTPDELVFTKSGSKPKTIHISTYPANKPRSFMYSAMPGFAWASSGWPADGYTQPSYQFRPEENTTGKNLTGTITVYISEGINVAQATVRIMQYADDLEFSPTLYNDYPAIGGSSLKFAVSSALPWMVTNISEGFLSVNDTSLQPEGSVDYFFTLLSNNTYQKRSVVLTIDNTNEDDFTPQTLTIVQAYAPPAFTNVSGVSFGTGTTAKSLKFDANSDWSFTMDANAHKIATPDKATGTTHTGGLASEPTSQAILLTPVDYTTPVVNSTPAAGSLTGNVVITSQNHAPHTPAVTTGNVAVSRTIPAHFSLTSTNTSIGRTGGNLTVKANTNAYWRAVPTTGTASTVQNPATYGDKSTTVEIPANTTWSTTTSVVNRTITVNTAYGLTNALGTNGTSFTVSQPGYYISGGTVTDTSTPSARTGGYVTIRVNGDYTNTTIASRISGATSNLATAIVAAGTANFNTVPIPENKTWSKTTSAVNRTVMVGYIHPSTAIFTSVASYNQPGYYISGGTVTSASVPSTGGEGSATIRINGDYSNVTIVSRLSGSTSNLASATVLPGTSNSATVKIPAYEDWGTRTVTVGYIHPDTNAYVVCGTYTQTGYSFTEVSKSITWTDGVASGHISFTGTFPAFTVYAQGGLSITVPATTNSTRTVHMSLVSYTTWSPGNTYYQWSYYHPQTGTIISTGDMYRRSNTWSSTYRLSVQ